MTQLPTPSFEASAHSQAVLAHIKALIAQNNGWLSFRDVMHEALYAHGLGYYTVGHQKFGAGGDFVTAPELSPLFARSLANQMSQILHKTGGNVLELGAGTGSLAKELLLTFAETNSLPEQYFILEVSSHLRFEQQSNLKHALPDELFERVKWIDVLPDSMRGVIFGNEVLDALPVHLVCNQNGFTYERGVTLLNDTLSWHDRPLSEKSMLYELVSELDLPNGYLTEVCLEATGLIKSLCDCLSQGAILMIDYGFDVNTYYHAQRREGTLMCHYQQHAHSDPLINLGLQDITAHVNFTQIAQAGFDKGLHVAGYTTQAQFLMNCGILQHMETYDPNDLVSYAPMASGVQKLLSPTEMGELFKVICMTKAFDTPCIGFLQGDKTHTL